MNRKGSLINRALYVRRSEMAGAEGNQRGWRGGQGSMFIIYTKTSIFLQTEKLF